MKEVIAWCNCKQGFLPAVLSVLTILISIFTIALSWKIGKMPYLKKVSICFWFNGEREAGYCAKIAVVNIGNAPLYIKEIYITDKKNRHLGYKNFFDGKKDFKILKSNEELYEDIYVSDKKKDFKKYDLDFNGRIKVIVEEVNGKKYCASKGWPVG